MDFTRESASQHHPCEPCAHVHAEARLGVPCVVAKPDLGLRGECRSCVGGSCDPGGLEPEPLPGGTVINPKAPVIKVERAWAYAKGNLTAGGRWREPHTESQPSAVTVTSARRRRPIPPRFSGVGLPRGITVRRWGWRNAVVDDYPCHQHRSGQQRRFGIHGPVAS